jgi:hypothetical protein
MSSALARAAFAAALAATFAAPVVASCDDGPQSRRITGGAHGRYEVVKLAGESMPGVKDLDTGTVWKMCVEGMAWWSPSPRIPASCGIAPTAKSNSHSFVIGPALQADYGAWRLPTRDELESLLTKQGDGPTDAQIDPIFGPVNDAQTFLSSTLCAPAPGVTMAGVVDFQKGMLGWERADTSGKVFVRLVRK